GRGGVWEQAGCVALGARPGRGRTWESVVLKCARCGPPILSFATIVEIRFASDPMHIWTACRAQKMRNPLNNSKSCWMPAFIRSFSLTRINDDRQVAHGLFDELFGTMARRRIEEQCVARPHHVAAVSVSITDFAREHIKKFDAGVTKMSIGKRVFAERDQIRFDP